MARKKTEKKMPPTAEPKLKAIRLDFPPELHRLMRLLAANADMSMAAYARDRLEQVMREEAKKEGIKP